MFDGRTDTFDINIVHIVDEQYGVGIADADGPHRVAGNLYDIEVIVKYEIENFKDKPVTLDVQESLRHIRNEVGGDPGRDVDDYVAVVSDHAAVWASFFTDRDDD